MADNYLEYHREEYEKRKSMWLAKRKKSHAPQKMNKNKSDSTNPTVITN